MDTPFTYNKFVTGSNFIARQKELTLLTNLVRQGQHSLIYEPPKSGKKSLVQQALINLRKENHSFSAANINLFNVRTKRLLLCKLCNTLLDLFSNSLDEKDKLLSELCPGISYFSIEDQMDSDPEIDTRPIDDDTTRSLLNLPELLSQKFSVKVVVYIEEFQEILLQDNSYDTLDIIEKAMMEHKHSTYIITGSFVNSMKEIFEEKKYFYNFAERIKLEPFDEKSLSDFYIRSFLKAGRVVSKELASMMYYLTEGHPWYAQQLGDITFGITRGYLSEQIVRQSFSSLLELHSYRYQLITSRLSRFQINFLRAIMDEIQHFSSNDVMNYYGFNSSANVKRLKDAVKRKEILTEENGQWQFLDPLFKTWLRSVYFQM